MCDISPRYHRYIARTKSDIQRLSFTLLFHNTVSVKLDRNQRWLSSKEFLRNEYGINANYSSKHHNYYSAWTYVTKEDENFVESAGHPALRMPVNLRQVPQVVLRGITNAKGMLQTKIMAMRRTRTVTTTKILTRVRLEEVLAPERESVLRHSR